MLPQTVSQQTVLNMELNTLYHLWRYSQRLIHTLHTAISLAGRAEYTAIIAESNAASEHALLVAAAQLIVTFLTTLLKSGQILSTFSEIQAIRFLCGGGQTG